jgi:hypothetical protein
MTTATDMLAAYLAAESAVLLGKEASIGERKLRYEDLAEIRAGRKEWESRVASENGVTTSAPAIGGLTFSLARLDQDG